MKKNKNNSMRKKMKILFAFPPLLRNKLFPLKNDLPPLGIAYLSACLKEKGYDASSIDMSGWDWKKVKEFIEKEKPDIVGVSCFTDTRDSADKLLKIAKLSSSKIITIMGGPHATFLDEQALSAYSVDIVVRGEAELTIVELINALEQGKDISKIEGITFKIKDKVIKTKDRKLISNLDSLPFPDYSSIKMSDYEKHIDVGTPNTDKGAGKIWGSIITSRGCPYRCSFCSSACFWGHRWRGRSVKSVVDEIEMLVKKGVEYLSIADDNFLLDQQRAISICKEIIKRKIEISFFCEGRVNNQTLECLQWLKKAGCDFVAFGVESGSPTILKEIEKSILPEQATNSFKLAKEAGLRTGCFFMVGNPKESIKTIRETMDWIDTVEIDVPMVALARLYPGTNLYSASKKKGFIDDSYWLTQEVAPYYTLDHSFFTLRLFQFMIISKLIKKQGLISYIRFLFSKVAKIKKFFK